jgi:hypothetical protein
MNDLIGHLIDFIDLIDLVGFDLYKKLKVNKERITTHHASPSKIRNKIKVK